MNTQYKRYNYFPEINQTQLEKYNDNTLCYSIIKSDVKPQTFIDRLIEYGNFPNPSKANNLKKCFASITNVNDCKRAIGVSFHTRSNAEIEMSDHAKEIFQRVIDTLESDKISNKQATCRIIADIIIHQLKDSLKHTTTNESLTKINAITEHFFILAYKFETRRETKETYGCFLGKNCENLVKYLKEGDKQKQNPKIILLLPIMVLLLCILLYKLLL